MLFTNVRKEEADQVLALYRSLIGTEGCVWVEEYPCETEVEFDLSRDALFCLKNDENEMVGVISIDDDPQVTNLECWSSDLEPAVELSRLGVKVSYQNQGIARILLTSLMDQLKTKGIKGVRLLVCKENEKAIRSYSKLDFHVAGETEMFGHEYWCYEKAL